MSHHHTKSAGDQALMIAPQGSVATKTPNVLASCASAGENSAAPIGAKVRIVSRCAAACRNSLRNLSCAPEKLSLVMSSAMARPQIVLCRQHRLRWNGNNSIGTHGKRKSRKLSFLNELSILENGVDVRATSILPRIRQGLDSINFVANEEFTGGAHDANDLFVGDAL